MRKIINGLIDIAKRNLVYLVILFACFILGVILGLIFKPEVVEEFICTNVYNRYAHIFNLEISVLYAPMLEILFHFLLLIIIFALGKIKYGYVVQFVIIFYFGYTFSFVLRLVCYLFSLSGFIVLIIIILPSYLLRFFSVSLLSVYLYDVNKCGYKNLKNRSYLLVILISFMICVIAFFWEILFVSIVARPFNLVL